ncbi:MAG: hypothetical protein LBC92_01340 [Rickettsiales bacterium]|jgi:hypothetical protein|nr:hypothetical protein [Rickettsiales bacterium]
MAENVRNKIVRDRPIRRPLLRSAKNSGSLIPQKYYKRDNGMIDINMSTLSADMAFSSGTNSDTQSQVLERFEVDSTSEIKINRSEINLPSTITDPLISSEGKSSIIADNCNFDKCRVISKNSKIRSKDSSVNGNLYVNDAVLSSTGSAINKGSSLTINGRPPQFREIGEQDYIIQEIDEQSSRPKIKPKVILNNSRFKGHIKVDLGMNSSLTMNGINSDSLGKKALGGGSGKLLSIEVPEGKICVMEDDTSGIYSSDSDISRYHPTQTTILDSSGCFMQVIKKTPRIVEDNAIVSQENSVPTQIPVENSALHQNSTENSEPLINRQPQPWQEGLLLTPLQHSIQTIIVEQNTHKNRGNFFRRHLSGNYVTNAVMGVIEQDNTLDSIESYKQIVAYMVRNDGKAVMERNVTRMCATLAEKRGEGLQDIRDNAERMRLDYMQILLPRGEQQQGRALPQ